MNKTSTPVIAVNKETCTSCHCCIAVCPAKFCNDASGDYVSVNSDLCLGCGACIDECHNKSRTGIDDADAFFEAMHDRKPFIAIVAPAIAASFDGKMLEFNDWLHQNGAKAIFDVSFGAELTVKSYMEYMKDKSPDLVIAQPCPAIVTYFEIYQPNMLEHLSPGDSPMQHTMKMIRNFFPEYDEYKILVVSPCYAKRREFDETGYGDYNVTINSFLSYFEKHSISLDNYQPRPYDGPQAERAVLFSSPGGLMRTAERFSPGISSKIRKIEGPSEVYHYFQGLERPDGDYSRSRYKLIDCLNCTAGCNGGTGTMNHRKYLDDLESPVEDRCDEACKLHNTTPGRKEKAGKKKLDALINSYWKPRLYDRKYHDRSDVYKNSVKMPTQAELNELYIKMQKFDKQDFLECQACGYASCEEMTIAIFNGTNKFDNCRHYSEKVLREKSKRELADKMNEVINSVVQKLETTVNQIGSLAEKSIDMSSCVVESSSSIEEMVSNIYSIKSVLDKNAETVVELGKISAEGKEGLTVVTNQIAQIAEESQGLVEASSIIQSIASQTNLLAMNAAIEAAHAGDFGRGFAVVADEIRKLAENSGQQAKTISSVLKQTKTRIEQTSELSTEERKRFDQLAGLAEKVRDQEQLIHGAIQEQSAGGKIVLEALSRMNDLTTAVKDNSNELNSTSNTIMTEIKQLSEEA
ncbi:MAG: methyl-accepting chemotaxis protein [Treponemataceae bacterium]